MQSLFKWVVPLLILCSLVLSQVAIFYWVAFESSGLLVVDDDVTDRPLRVPIQQSVSRPTVSHQVALQWSTPEELIAPSGLGADLVTFVDVASGDVVRSGDTILHVGNQRRIAIETRAPFHRSLQIRDTGDDVAMLQAALVKLGFLEEAEPDGRFGSRTRTAVRALQESLSVPKPDGLFRPEYVVWLRSPSITVGAVEVAEGSIVGAGSVVLTSRPVLEDASFRVDPQLDELQVQLAIKIGARNLKLEEFRMRVGELDPGFDAEIWELASAQSAQAASETGEGPSGAETSVPDFLTVEIGPFDPLDTWELSGSALLLTEDSRYCVLVDDGSEATQSVEVFIVGASYGIVTAVPAISLDRATGALISPSLASIEC